MILNLRGANGSGKTTLARGLLNEPTMREVPIGGVPCTTDHRGSVLLIGPYVGRKTGGCDCLPDFATIRKAITEAGMLYPNVVFEGVIVSTVYGSWATYDDARGRDVVWAFLDTPLETCLARIQARNGGKPIKENLVADKHKSIAVVREKAIADRRIVMNLRTADPDLPRTVREGLS